MHGYRAALKSNKSKEFNSKGWWGFGERSVFIKKQTIRKLRRNLKSELNKELELCLEEQNG